VRHCSYYSKIRGVTAHRSEALPHLSPVGSGPVTVSRCSFSSVGPHPLLAPPCGAAPDTPPSLLMLEVLGEPCHCLSCPARSPGTPPTLPAHLFLHHRPTSSWETRHYTGRGCGDCAQCARRCATSRGRPSLLAMGQAGQAVAGPASCGFGPKSGPRLFRWFSLFNFFLFFSDLLFLGNPSKLQKFIENGLKLRKIKKLLESSWLDIGNRLDQIAFCAILPHRKFL
jgi:hypothetical protein